MTWDFSVGVGYATSWLRGFKKGELANIRTAGLCDGKSFPYAYLYHLHSTIEIAARRGCLHMCRCVQRPASTAALPDIFGVQDYYMIEYMHRNKCWR